MYRVCKQCRETKTIDEFYPAPSRNGRRIYRRTCKLCHNQNVQEWRKTDSGKVCLRTAQLRYDCGLSAEQYNNLFYEQGGVCAICGCIETVTTQNGEVRRLCIDHNHNSKIVRGLLCQACNIAIGLMKDDPLVLRRAADYLEQVGRHQLFAGKRSTAESVTVGVYT